MVRKSRKNAFTKVFNPVKKSVSKTMKLSKKIVGKTTSSIGHLLSFSVNTIGKAGKGIVSKANKTIRSGIKNVRKVTFRKSRRNRH